MDELGGVFHTVARYFGLLSEPTRLKIMHAICQRERPVNEIVEVVGATQTNVSRHLNMLYREGVVARRKQGNLVLYRVTDPMFTELCRTVCVHIVARVDAGEPFRRDVMALAADIAGAPRRRKARVARREAAHV